MPSRSPGCSAPSPPGGAPVPRAPSIRRPPWGRAEWAHRATAAAPRRRRRAGQPPAAGTPPAPPWLRRWRPQASAPTAHAPSPSASWQAPSATVPARTPRAQARPRVPLTAGHANPPLRQRRDRPEIRPPLRLGDATQALGDPPRAVEVPFFEVGVDQKREQRAHHGRLADRGNLVILTLGGPLEQLPRTRRLAPGEVQGGERGNDVRMLLESLQQQRGLLQAALPDTQVREADDGGGAPRRHPQVEVPGGLDQLGLGLLPASGGCQDAAVVGAAEGGDDVAPLHEVRGRTHPLVGARDVVDELARPQEPAEDLVN